MTLKELRIHILNMARLLQGEVKTIEGKTFSSYLIDNFNVTTIDDKTYTDFIMKLMNMDIQHYKRRWGL